MISRSFRIVAAALLIATPSLASAQLQTSKSYKFLQAVKDGKNQEVVDTLSKPGQTIINAQDYSSGQGALHYVVARGDTTYLRYLLQQGADPNLRDKDGVTPLMLAVNADQEPCLAILIAAHANPNLGNDRGETPLIRAVQRRDVEMVRELLAAGANPDQTDNLAGMSARDYADRDTRSPIIKKLLDDAKKQKVPQVAGPKF